MVTRRYFLVGLATTVGSAAYSYMVASGRQSIRTSSSDTDPMTVVPIAAETNYFDIVNSDFTIKTGVPSVLSQDLTVTNAAPLVVTVLFDGRIFAPMEYGVAAYLDRYEVLPVAVDSQSGPIASTLVYDVPDISDVDSDLVVTLSLPLTRIDSYPSEGVDGPLPLVLIISAVDGTELARTKWAPSSSVAVTSWGAEVTSTWSSTGVIDGAGLRATQYRYPQTLVCASVGPTDIPIGSRFTIDLDPNVIEACRVERVVTYPTSPSLDASTLSPVPPYSWTPLEYGLTSTIVNGVLRSELILNRSVSSGQTLEIAIKLDEKPGDPLLSSVVFASAVLTGADGQNYWQRATGKYNATDLTQSGTPQVADAAQGNI